MYIFNRIAGYLSVFFLAGMISYSSLAQVEVKWEKQLSSDILWQEVTALGNLIVSSGNQLAGVNTETGAIIWSSPELAGLNRIAYNEIPRSPFFAVDLGNSILVLDQFSGDLVFDSQKAGIGTIEDYFGMGQVGGILTAQGKQLSPHIAIQTAASSGAHLTKYSNITDLSTILTKYQYFRAFA